MTALTTAQTDRILSTLAMIRQDIRDDVARREGMPLNGATFGAALGEMCAQIDCLAGMLQVLVGGEPK